MVFWGKMQMYGWVAVFDGDVRLLSSTLVLVNSMLAKI